MFTNTQIKRLKIRSWRRGIRELDLILGKFADLHLENLSTTQLNNYEELLNKEDHLLYSWLADQKKVHPTFKSIITTIIQVTELDA